jgi:hypothetical protein
MTRMAKRLREAVNRVVDAHLPGASEYADNNPTIKAWIDKQAARAKQAVDDRDEILFDNAIGTWAKAWERVNELLAEEYRAKTPQPELWELRYVKWMKINSITFTSPHGDFVLYPRPPKWPPTDARWFTADEMIDMVSTPGIAASIAAFGGLPVRPESLTKPVTGEQDLVVDLTVRNEPAIRAIVGRPYARYGK